MIGIDHYRDWPRLANAVSDASGVLATFEKLGFEPIGEPLIDARATREAMHRFVVDDLRELGTDDSLVLFFAGHGHTIATPFPSGGSLRTGYIIPVDAESGHGCRHTWIRLDSWLSDVARLRARHILVILDACNSGIALNNVVIRHPRGGILYDAAPIEHLRARASRQVMTSALDDQLALDSGPRPQHSLFTGCLLDALASGLAPSVPRLVTGSEIWSHVRSQVMAYPGSHQTPDFGAIEQDERGELILELPGPSPIRRRGPKPKQQPARAAAVGSAANRIRNLAAGPSADRGRRAPTRPQPPSHAPSVARPAPPPPPPVTRAAEPLLDAAFAAALDRQDTERLRGSSGLSLLEGDPTTALADWAAWAAGCGYLPLVTEGAGLDAGITELLAQWPWLRCLGEARRRLAKAAGHEVDAIEAALDARSDYERRAWIDYIAGTDPRVRVSGWLLSVIREPGAGPRDLSAAPVQGSALISILCELAAPIAVIVHRAHPTAEWLDRALETAAALMQHLPGHSIAVSAPPALVTKALGRRRDSTALALARQGRVTVAARPARPAAPARAPLQTLHDALARDPRTAGQLERNVRLMLSNDATPVAVDLVARKARFAVAIYGWYRGPDLQRFHRERADAARLQRAGFYLMRFTAEDIDQRLALVVNEIALGLAGRRAAGPFSGAPR